MVDPTQSPRLYLPVFAGQGTTAVDSPQSRRQALLDASSASGSILLSECHAIFHAELSSLSSVDLLNVQVDPADFRARETLLSVPEERYALNRIILGSAFFLIQSLRYLAFVEEYGLTTNSSTPFIDILKSNSEYNVGIIGFSWGILAACVASTSYTPLAYISNAVEVYRLVLWIAIRSQLYRRATLEAGSLDRDSKLPWSLVFVGISEGEAKNAIQDFNKEFKFETSRLYITAIMDATCVTISGRPDILAAFAAQLKFTKDDVIVIKTNICSLYHTPIHSNGLLPRVLDDVVSRKIRFPDFSDLKVPLWSTHSGNHITNDGKGSLVEVIVDMLLTQPVNWKLLVENFVASCPSEVPIRIINVGPGASLIRGLERPFPKGAVSVVDLTTTGSTAPQPAKAKHEPIAIIGMAVNMPGSPNSSKLWELLEQGINTISEVIPEYRFQVSNYAEGKNNKRTMKVHTGNFIDGIDEFDNKFFKISPREAKSMDPQQRILLHTAYEALEDAGYMPNSTPTFRTESFGCYIGNSTHDYLENLRDDIDVYYSTGTLKSFLSGRLSYAMQLGGPSMVVDTACSSSNVALYQGARALMNQDCDAALVGGVNLIFSPDMFLGLDRGHFLSPTGQCKAFDESADGYSRSDGCGLFVLKRLCDAESENDRILGVIRGIEVNQSGRAHSITHPHSPTQAALFQRLLDNTGMDPNRINLVEAHGTGTQAGDPSELEAIRSVLSRERSKDNPLHITSIKANIGHLESASGAAGLAKLLLMLRHRTIPRQILFNKLNPRITPLDVDNTMINVVPVPWKPSHEGLTRVALLNNFGASGSNTALLLEEHPTSPSLVSESQGMHFVFGMSAKDVSTLEALREKYLQFFRAPDGISFRDVAYTSTARRQLYHHRIAVSANSVDDLTGKLSKALPVQVASQNGRIVFVFSGQGGQYLGMGRTLYQTAPLFKSHIDECHNMLVKAGFPGVHAIINADVGADTSGLSVLEEFEAYQAAIFSLEYALAQLWISWGLLPMAVIGHSLGEYAALVIASVLSLKDALLIVANRVRFMVQRCEVNSTGMIAVNLDPSGVGEALKVSDDFTDLTIACYNSSIDCAVSGPLLKLRNFKKHLDKEVGCKSVLLTVPFGYHGSAMIPVVEELTAFAHRVTLNAPLIPVISNVSGEVVLPGDSSVFDAGYFASHCTEPVQFDKGIRSLMSHSSFGSVDAWIEIGPHPTTLPMLKSNASLPRGSTLLGSMRKGQDSWSTLTTSLSHLYTSGIEVNWRNVFAHVSKPTCISLPSYPFSKTKFWVAYKEPVSNNELASLRTGPEPQLLTTGKSMLHTWLQYPSMENGHVAIFETPIKKLDQWIVGHKVGGVPLCPASMYTEQILAGVHLVCSRLGISLVGSHVVIRRMKFAQPLVYEEEVERIVTTTITIKDRSGVFSVGSRLASSSDQDIHSNGEFRVQSTSQTVSKFTRTFPVVSRNMGTVIRPKDGRMPEVFSTRTAYDVIFPRVVDYSKEYQAMRSVTVDPSGMEGCADVRLPAGRGRGTFIVHPVFVDTLLHVAGFVASLQGGPNDAYICNEVGSVNVVSNLIDENSSYTFYCRNAWIPEEGVMFSDAYAVLNVEPKKIVAHVKEMQFRLVGLDRLKRGLARASGKSSLLPAFQMKPSSRPKSRPPLGRYPQRGQPTNLEDAPDISGIIVGIISETCDISTEKLDVHTELDAIGVDSLMSIEIMGRLGSVFPSVDLNVQLLSYCKNIGDVIREVSPKVSLGNSGMKELPQTDSSGPPSPRTPATDDTLLNISHLSVDDGFDVKRVLASVLEMDVDHIEEDTDFECLGLDSLSSIEALHALKHEFGLDLPTDFFSVFQTPRTVQSYVSSHLQTSRTLASPAGFITPDARQKETNGTWTFLSSLRDALQINIIPVPIQKSDSGRSPLFLIHDGSGLTNYYDHLPALGRPVWGIQNPHFATAQPWASVVKMAQSYTEYVMSRTAGPVILGGWSFGGVVAYEVALQLRKKNVDVRGILLIDSPSPINHAPLSDSVIDAVLSGDSANSKSSEVRRLVKAQFSMNAQLLGQHHPEGGSYPSERMVFLRSREGFNPSNIPNIPSWLSDRSNPRLAVAGWESIVRSPIKSIDIPGNHFEPFHSSNIHDVGLRMAEGCNYLEGLQ